ncbi:metal-sensing transcriptional repressor [Baileyella intestinalis]|uniref:metal-sensing transcriptional repressor n=1 Tax=Baileyella intestinalis TaxID=2606709 RepID=UPI003A88E81F
MSPENCSCCSDRKKNRSPEEKKKLMNRLKRIEGQVRGLEKMIEADAYCPDVLIQSSAINSAMNGFSKELLASHLRSCVVEDIRSGKDEAVDELVELLRKLMK